MWIVRVTSKDGAFALILRKELKQVAYNLYQRFVENAQRDETIVELLVEELGINHI